MNNNCNINRRFGYCFYDFQHSWIQYLIALPNSTAEIPNNIADVIMCWTLALKPCSIIWHCSSPYVFELHEKYTGLAMSSRGEFSNDFLYFKGTKTNIFTPTTVIELIVMYLSTLQMKETYPGFSTSLGTRL